MAGFVASGFEAVREAFDAHLSEELGASFAVVRDGEILVHVWGGFADRARARPWAHDTIAPIHSTTKPIAALALTKICVDAGIDFETAVADIWPEFGSEGKGAITIAQALSHQAGLAGFPDPIDPALWLDPPALAAALARLAPLWPPGSASGYHPLTWGYIVGELARRIARRELGAILHDDICAPRGIDVFIGLPESADARTAEMRLPPRLPDLGEMTPIKRAAFFEKWSSLPRLDPRARRIDIPSANGHAGALAVAQLFGVYAQRGGDLLPPEAFDMLTRPRTEGQDLVLPFAVDWRAGVLGNNLGFYGPETQALGHYGWGGSCGAADAVRGLSFGYVMNKQSVHLMGDPRPRALIEATYACL